MKTIGTACVEISVVTPMYNEELCVREFFHRLYDALAAMGETFEIIIVDDGSTDHTPRLLQELRGVFPELRPLRLSRNCGQWAAVYAGLQYSRGEYVVVMDGDLQNLPEEIPLLISCIRKGYDLVSGMRVRRTESFLRRRLPSRIANWLLRATTGCAVRDMGGFKCLRGSIARSLRLRAGQHRLLPALVHLAGGRVCEIPITAAPRFAGKSHYGLSRSLDVLLDILMLWFQSSCKSRPLYLFGRMSLGLLSLGVLLSCWQLYAALGSGDAPSSGPLFLATVVAYVASLGFMSVGFGLELLSETLHAVTDYKPYQVVPQPFREVSEETLEEEVHRRAA